MCMYRIVYTDIFSAKMETNICSLLYRRAVHLSFPSRSLLVIFRIFLSSVYVCLSIYLFRLSACPSVFVSPCLCLYICLPFCVLTTSLFASSDLPVKP